MTALEQTLSDALVELEAAIYCVVDTTDADQVDYCRECGAGKDVRPHSATCGDGNLLARVTRAIEETAEMFSLLRRTEGLLGRFDEPMDSSGLRADVQRALLENRAL